MESSPALEVRNLGKSYGATVALADASLAIEAGEIHAILGENGAGKSTLVKILSGVTRPDRGELHIDGRQPQSFRTILDARRIGIATAFQELSLLPNLSVTDNLMLPALRRGALGLTSKSANLQQASRILADFEVTDIDPAVPVESLTLAEKQRIEITRALSHATKVLVLDEPSAALADTTWLFRQIRRRSDNGVAVIYISHRLNEIRSLCSRATVLRNGHSIDSVDLDGVDDDHIFEMMVGHAPESSESRTGTTRPDKQPVFEVRNVHAGKARDIDFTLHAGEILGMAALEGQGQRDLFRALAGLQSLDAGELLVAGQPTRLRSTRQALRSGPGIAFVPEERKIEGIFSGMRAAANVALPHAFRLSRFGFLNHHLERRYAARVTGQVDLLPRYLDFRINALSGGNQQKVVLARALASGAGILVLFDPTRGVDVGTKESIYQMIRDFAEDGGAVLLYSSEIPELIQICNRCLVLYQGRTCAELSGDRITEQALISGIVGHNLHADPALAEAS